MASISHSGREGGIESPESVECFDIQPDDSTHMAPHDRPVWVVMWHGNGYKRDDCWLQIDADAVCDLDCWL